MQSVRLADSAQGSRRYKRVILLMYDMENKNVAGGSSRGSASFVWCVGRGISYPVPRPHSKRRNNNNPTPGHPQVTLFRLNLI